MAIESPMLGLPKKEEPEEELGELEDCMSDLGEALAEKDWGAAAMAFRRGHEICAGGYDDDEEEIDEE